MKCAISAAALAAAVPMVVCSAQAADLTAEVMHQWVSAGESAAINEVAKAYEAAGGTWRDNAIAGGDVAIPAIISRILGGEPPTASQMPLGKQLDDLVAGGLLANLDDAAKETGFLDNIPEVLKKASTYPDGHMYALPINNQSYDWVWYNKKVLADAGIEEPTTWDDFFAAVDAIKAKGEAIPIAVGAQPWQLANTFYGVMLTKGGSDLYYKVFRNLDIDAVKSIAFRDTINTFLKLRDYSDAGATNRDWNVATNMVITGKAGFQFMGDWAKGEFLAANQTPDVEFGCQILGNGDGKQYFQISSDTIIFPTNNKPGQAEAQALLQRVIMSKDVQIAFNLHKGSEPARLDVDINKLDACSKKGMQILQKPEQRVPTPEFLVTPDTIGAVKDLTAQAWANPAMDVDKVVERFAQIIETEKSIH